MTDMQPGQLIVPHDDQTPADGVPAQPSVPSQPAVPVSVPPAPLPPAPAALPQPVPTPDPVAQPVAEQPVTTAAVPAVPVEPATSFYTPQGSLPAAAPLPSSQSAGAEDGEVMWTAAEFVENHKGISWYLSLFGVGAVAAAIAYFLLKDLFSSVVITLAVVTFAVYASRKPQEQQYHLSTFGVQVGTKVYEFHDFKAFSVLHDGDVISIALRPLKRFMPSPSLYVIPEVEDRVIELLSMVMPAEQHRSDAIDNLMRKIRF